MRSKNIISVILACAMLLFCGCSGAGKDEYVIKSKNYTFTSEMVEYMVVYTRSMLEDEMKEAGVDGSKPLSEQMYADGKTWEEYLQDKTRENIEYILLYCEAASLDGYTPDEGTLYKANENVSYIDRLAKDAGLSVEEYVKKSYGESVTLEGIRICTEMMAVCEGYELSLSEKTDVSEDDIAEYASKNRDELLRFDALRYTVNDKAVADELMLCADAKSFAGKVSSVSGTDLTDKDKNGIPDLCEVRRVSVVSDPAGEYANDPERKVGDVTVSEKNGEYTVTMILTLPEMDETPLWDFRMVYISSGTSNDPYGDAKSLIEQWKEKNGGETGFSNLAARYSDDPTAYYGGLFSGTSKADMPTEKVAEWVCDSARITGDATAIEAEDGAYMLYYIGGNIPSWQREVSQRIKSDKAKEKIASVEDGIRSEFVINDKLFAKIVKE